MKCFMWPAVRANTLCASSPLRSLARSAQKLNNFPLIIGPQRGKKWPKVVLLFFVRTFVAQLNRELERAATGKRAGEPRARAHQWAFQANGWRHLTGWRRFAPASKSN